MKWNKSRKQGAMLLLSAVMSMSLAGCGTGNSTSAGGASTSTPEATGAAASTPEATEAALSGKLVLYSAGPQGLADDIVNGFKAKTGLTVEMFQGTTGKILARMEAEKANPVADVVILASLPSAQALKADGLTLPYPEAANKEKLNQDWSDAEGNYFSSSASALGIVYNTKLVANPPKTWAELAGMEWKDAVNIPDPTLSGSALDFITGYLSVNGEQGWDLFKNYKANGVAMAGANQEALDPVITGAKSIVAAGVDYMAYKAKAKGEPLDIIYPEEGTVVSPRPAAILKSSPNVANAKAFIDYLLSDEAQQLVADAYLIPGREDIEASNRTNLKDIPQLKVDWAWMSEHGNETASKFAEIYK
ncbi:MULTISPECIES: ABC transporter substrate-binding protein [unclassified Paenibacillus]|uniref:ABC transporter substrate-binding protein n=1 Tax=unclassified Paenibacillus TaxID=185978 RepID=UPI0003E2293F|nr:MULTISPECIES: ABC transporter substrate-binding protein [unclassified Paenibacillus]ETT42449.1 ferric transport system permease protein FbpB [Paenibacillus sp. FSL R7-269]OMF93025.1 ABC transporter substrate-binding protein [Paenibacillus sp. FSL R7-0337]